MRHMLADFGYEVPPPILHTDSSAAVDMCKKRVIGRVKHLDRQLHFMRELVDEVSHISGSDNPADVMTKHVDRATLEYHRPFVLGTR